MIQLNIISKEPKQVKEIVEFLINKELLTSVIVLDSVSSYKNDKGEIETVLTNLIIGITKVVFFSGIEKLLQNKYGQYMPVIYGTPIVDIDYRHLEKLKKTM